MDTILIGASVDLAGAPGSQGTSFVRNAFRVDLFGVFSAQTPVREYSRAFYHLVRHKASLCERISRNERALL